MRVTQLPPRVLSMRGPDAIACEAVCPWIPARAFRASGMTSQQMQIVSATRVWIPAFAGMTTPIDCPSLSWMPGPRPGMTRDADAGALLPLREKVGFALAKLG
ncbi:MAG: hypothetical protein QOF80_2024 [Verrucomicrobiota bacterium]|jgi:hypothetical protein